MTNLERVAYIRGLAEGLELDTDKKEVKVLYIEGDGVMLKTKTNDRLRNDILLEIEKMKKIY